MPHKKNPAEGHNPFDVVGHAKSGPPTSNVTTKKPKTVGRSTTPAAKRADKKRDAAARKRLNAKKRKKLKAQKARGNKR